MNYTKCNFFMKVTVIMTFKDNIRFHDGHDLCRWRFQAPLLSTAPRPHQLVNHCSFLLMATLNLHPFFYATAPKDFGYEGRGVLFDEFKHFGESVSDKIGFLLCAKSVRGDEENS